MKNRFMGDIIILDAEDTQFYTLKEENFYDLYSSYKKSGFLGLGIYSEHSAVLLSNLIRYAYYAYKNFNTNNSFRLFYDLNLVVAINCFGEVGINVRNLESIYAAYTKENLLALIKNLKFKFAKILDKFISEYSIEDSIQNVAATMYDSSSIIKFNEKFNCKEYSVLLQFLKGQDVTVICEKFGNDVYDKMIGKKDLDQFKFIAIETLFNEISKIVEERNQILSEMKKEHERNILALQVEQNTKFSIKEKFYKDKIDDLELRIREMRN
jgi:hypothetical protein